MLDADLEGIAIVIVRIDGIAVGGPIGPLEDNDETALTDNDGLTLFAGW